ncbi:MAG: YraN family protein [Caldicoprobacterales bacterium]|jgi:putative endonuclease|nr:YraN family protein [Clostridiales bacterium]
MSRERQELGKWGEEQGCSYLSSRGWEILRRNYRSALGEVDIIASQGDQLIFVEVKTRRSTAYGYPAESVNYKKRLKYEQLALYFLKETGRIDSSCRFDVLEVIVNRDNTFCINHIVNAFQAQSSRYY